MTSPTTVRSYAIFDNDKNFYDWVNTSDGEGNVLALEHHVSIEGQADIETFLEDKTQKPVKDLTAREWQVIHTCEAKLTHQLKSREDAIAYLEELIESGKKGDLCYEPSRVLTDSLEAILAMLRDGDNPDQSISMWFDQAITFSKVNL